MGINAELIRTSLEVIMERESRITPRFYDLLFSRHPEVRPLFGRNDSDLQQRMLQESLVAVVDHIEDSAWLVETLGAMGAQHVSYGVRADMYPCVSSCLLDTLREIAGEAWTDEHDTAWGSALDAICTHMLEGAAREQASDAARASIA